MQVYMVSFFMFPEHLFSLALTVVSSSLSFGYVEVSSGETAILLTCFCFTDSCMYLHLLSNLAMMGKHGAMYTAEIA